MLPVRRRGIDGWHIIEQVSGQLKYVRPTQWPEWWWHFQTHGSMIVYTVWKNIDQQAHFRKRHRNPNSATKINLFIKAKGESERRLEILASECEGLKSNNYDAGMLFILGVRDTLLFFRISENITSKSWGFSFHGVTHDISAFSFFLLGSLPALLLLFLHFWTIVFRKTSKSFECLAGCTEAHACVWCQSLKEIVQRPYSCHSSSICHCTLSYLV